MFFFANTSASYELSSLAATQCVWSAQESCGEGKSQSGWLHNHNHSHDQIITINQSKDHKNFLVPFLLFFLLAVCEAIDWCIDHHQGGWPCAIWEDCIYKALNIIHRYCWHFSITLINILDVKKWIISNLSFCLNIFQVCIYLQKIDTQPPLHLPSNISTSSRILGPVEWGHRTMGTWNGP